MRKIAIILVIAFFYALLAKLCQLLVGPNAIVIPIWPPAGIALAALLIFENIALIGIFIGGFFSNLHMFVGQELILNAILLTCIPALGGALQASLGVLALEKFAGTKNIFANTRSVLVFIFISAFAACLVNSTLGTGTLLLTATISTAAFAFNWVTWWISDAVGVIAVASTIIAWHQEGYKKIPLAQILKLGITWIFVLVIGYIVVTIHLPLTYLFIPVAIWSAFQFEVRFSLLTGLAISALFIYAITRGYGVINTRFGEIAIVLVQVYISIIYLTILLIDAILSDRQKAYANLKLLNEQLEKRVLDRTKDLSTSNQELEIQKNKAIEAFVALKQSHARLMQSEKMASLGILTAGVAHEIKHPLNAMWANMDSLKTNLKSIVSTVDHSHLDEKIKHDVNDISKTSETLIGATNEGIKRTAGILADLCAFARADEGEMVETDLNQNIDSTLNLLSSEMKNIKVVKEYGPIPALICHPGKINQVIMNILINAIHALQGRPNSIITIQTGSNQDSIILKIQDNGPGMKDEVLKKLFTAFFTTKSSGSGSGLGLFISQNIIKEHGGKISVESELNKGTTFTITLPIQGV